MLFKIRLWICHSFRRSLQFRNFFIVLFCLGILNFIWIFEKESRSLKRCLEKTAPIIPKKPEKEEFSATEFAKVPGIKTYFEPKTKICEHFTQHGDLMMEFTKMVLNTSALGGHPGGEDYNLVKFQEENSEYPQLSEGFFNIDCSSVDISKIHTDHSHSHFREYLQATKFAKFDGLFLENFQDTSDTTVFIVRRIDYVNMYHVSMDWYDIYITAQRLRISLANIHILILDAHPTDMFESTWMTLFGGFSRIGEYRSQYFSNNPNLLPSHGEKDFTNEHLQSRLIYLNKAVWNPPNYLSPPFKHITSENMYLLEEFRSFVLARNSISNLKIEPLDPNEQPNISECRPKAVFILRRHYFSHPRQKAVFRKIANEQEILYWLRNATITIKGSLFPLLHSIVAMQPDMLHFSNQLRVVHSADILIGVHGAGLTHSLYIPPMSGVVELLPVMYKNSKFEYQSISRWRNHSYRSWRNSTPQLEPTEEVMRIPSKMVVKLVSEVISNFKRKFIQCVQ